MSFTEALRTAARPLVLEVKRTDGHGADLLGGRSVAEVVAGFEAAGAPCVSVVTGAWFGGDAELLRSVRGLTDLPLLRKDFITRRAQLLASRELGATAVLLTARLLPGVALRDLAEEALTLGLTPFVEVHDAAQAAKVRCGPETVVAVANKDIGTRERDAGDLGRGIGLLPAVLRTGTSCPVSASGIGSPAEAAGLLRAGFSGLLIGTGVLRADLAAWVADFDALHTPWVRP